MPHSRCNRAFAETQKWEAVERVLNDVKRFANTLKSTLLCLKLREPLGENIVYAFFNYIVAGQVG